MSLPACEISPSAPREAAIVAERGSARRLCQGLLAATTCFLVALLFCSSTAASGAEGSVHQGELLLKKHAYAEAVRYFDGYLQKQGADADAFLQRGLAYAGLRQFNEADRDISQSISLRRCAPAFIARAQVFQARGKTGAALSDLEEAVKLEPKNAANQRKLAQQYFDLQRWEQVVECASQILKLQAGDLDTLVMRAKAHHHLHDEEAAIADALVVLKGKPNDSRMLLVIAQGRMRQRQFAEAIEYARRAVHLSPREQTLYEIQSSSYVQLKRYADAVAVLDLAIKQLPGKEHLHRQKAHVLVLMHKLEPALVEANKAVQLDPRHNAVYWCRAEVLESMGRQAEAKADVARADSLHHRIPSPPDEANKLAFP